MVGVGHEKDGGDVWWDQRVWHYEGDGRIRKEGKVDMVLVMSKWCGITKLPKVLQGGVVWLSGHN